MNKRHFKSRREWISIEYREDLYKNDRGKGIVEEERRMYRIRNAECERNNE